MTELGQSLANDVTARFMRYLETDKQAVRLARRAVNSADYEAANRYSVRTGELMAQALADETQTLAYLSYDVARETLTPLMTANHEAVTTIAQTVQTNINQAAGVDLAPALLELDTSRIDGLAVVAAQAETADEALQRIAEPLVNSSQSIVDRSIRDNARINSKAGLSPKIVRRTEAGGIRTAPLRIKRGNKVYTYTRKYIVPCNWCARLAGTYDYAEVRDRGNDVYRRHEGCRCTITYYNGTKRQDVYSKAEWTEADASRSREIIAQREREIEIRREQEREASQRYSNVINRIIVELGYSERTAKWWYRTNYGYIMRYGLNYMIDAERNYNRQQQNIARVAS